MQQGVQMDATCNIQQCWELLANNVASICMGPNPFMPCPDLQYTEQPCLLAKFAHTVENQTWKNYSPLQKQEGNCPEPKCILQLFLGSLLGPTSGQPVQSPIGHFFPVPSNGPRNLRIN